MILKRARFISDPESTFGDFFEVDVLVLVVVMMKDEGEVLMLWYVEHVAG